VTKRNGRQEQKVRPATTNRVTERGRTEDALRENEVRALVENSPDIILRFDTEMRHVYANQAIERVTGLSPRAVIGKTHPELGMPASAVAFWQESLGKVFRSGEEDVVRFEYPTPDGITYFESRVVPEFGQGGEVESVLVLARDITDRKRAEEALERARAKLLSVEILPYTYLSLPCSCRQDTDDSADSLTWALQAKCLPHKRAPSTSTQLLKPPLPQCYT